MTVAQLIESLLGSDLPVAIRAFDGTTVGPTDAAATLVVRSSNALTRLVQAPGELGFGRAFVTGELDVEGDIFAALALRDRLPTVRLRGRQWIDAARIVGPAALRPLRPPAEEARLHGRRHTKERDRAAVSYHYDVSNDFYRLILGPSMTYSCGVWADPNVGLDRAQAAKYELICRKLDLQPGQRLLDVGCGWGGMVTHAAVHHGASSVGVTLARRQQEWAAKAIAEAGLGSQVQVRLEDYRDIQDDRYDAISSIGMFEHVGLARLREYFDRLYRLVKPGGRVLNHGISRQTIEPVPVGGQRFQFRPDWLPPRSRFNGFLDRYVFPDGELHAVGTVVSIMEEAGFEVRHVESLREHYALTLRAWVANLEANWDDAVEAAGPGRARIWRLYMAASALNFEASRSSIHQIVAVRRDGSSSGFPLRPTLS
jgi:cyclopropane-fatty-acyl-phospholipid synthase